jgi:hypothetical protein
VVERNFDRDEFRPDPADREQIARDREREQQRRDDERRRAQQRQDAIEQAARDSLRRMADVVNDPAIQIDQAMLRAINDPEMVMMPTGEVARVVSRERTGLGTGAFANQFSSLRGFSLPQEPKKKTRRKKNPKLASAFREANRRYRTKSGKLRKGRTQADIARLAHRLLKKM